MALLSHLPETPALLIIVVILFNLGARALGNHLYRKFTAAKA